MPPASDRSAVWDEVAELYGEGVSPFGRFSRRMVEIARLSPGDRVLDVGTGNGLSLVPAAQAVAPAVVVGIDFSRRMREAARRRASAAGVRNVELVHMDAADLRFPDETFDVVIASAVLHFLGYSRDVLAEWRRVLRPGGRLVVSTPETGYAAYESMKILMDLVEEHAAELPPKARERVGVARGDGSPLPDVAELCLRAGFSAAFRREWRVRAVLPDVEDWWRLQWTHGSRIFLRQFDKASLAEMKREAATRLEPFRENGGGIPVVIAVAVCQAVR